MIQIIKFFALIGCLIINFQVLSSEAETTLCDDTTFVIATGKAGGGYYNFAHQLNKFLAKDCISFQVMTSNGSVDNFNKLKNNEADLALVQSDVSHKTFEHFQGYSTVFPLFNEYIQLIARKDSGVWFGDLKSKPVLIGKKNSGTEVNAKDILEISGLTTNVVNGDLCSELKNTSVLAGFATSKNNISCQSLDTQNLAIPLSFLNQIVKQKPYYSIVDSNSNFANEPFLSIQAYLVVRNNLEQNKLLQLQTIVKTLGDNWDLLDKHMIPLSKALNANVKPKVHPVVKDALVNNKFAVDSSRGKILFIFLIFLSIVFWSLKSRLAQYDRSGNKNSLRIAIKNIVISMATITTILAFFTGFNILFQYYEQDFPNSLFTNKDILDLMLWTLTYISTGFTENIFPSSPQGHAMTTILGVVGVLAIIALLYKWINQSNEKIKKKNRGELSHNLHNHVLICGWNEKVPDLIYSLTCNSAPEKKKIIVIAEIDKEYPLEEYEFDSGYVHYYRGDSANSTVLKNVSVDKASTAIIVAGEKKKDADNVNIVLTAIALKEINPNIFITTELLYTQHRQYFESIGVDVILDFNLIRKHLVVLSAISPNIIDFVLDTLTYDQFTELYSISVSEIKKKYTWRNKVLSQLFKSDNMSDNILSELLKSGANIIGYSNGSDRQKGLLKANFDNNTSVTPIFTGKEVLDINDKDTLFYIAQNINNILPNRKIQIEEKQTNTYLQPNYEKSHKILIIGQSSEEFDEIKQLYALAANITQVYFFENIVQDNIVINTDEILKIIKQNEISHLAILSSMTSKQQSVSKDKGRLDAASILITKVVKNCYPDIFIISELINFNSKSMLESAGADVTISQSIFTSRFFAKTVYNRGKVVDFLHGLLDFSDGVFLHSIKVEGGSSLIGSKYTEIWLSTFKNARIVACIPTSMRQSLMNKQKDFNMHFITNPELLNGVTIKQDDIIILLAKRVESL